MKNSNSKNLANILVASTLTLVTAQSASAWDTDLTLIAANPVETSMVLRGSYQAEKPYTGKPVTSKSTGSAETVSTADATSSTDTTSGTEASNSTSTSAASTDSAPNWDGVNNKEERKEESASIFDSEPAKTTDAAATEKPASTAKTDKAVSDKDELKTGISVNKHIKNAPKLDGQAITSPKLQCVEFAAASDPFEEAINSAAIVAMERDPELVDADNKLFKMQGVSQNAKEISRNFLHYLLNYRGVGPSSASANALMERNINTSSVLAAELKWEKAVDEKYVSTVNASAELAEAMDMEEGDGKSQAIADATANLSLLLGSEEADKLVNKFKALKKVLPQAAPKANNLSVAAERARIRVLEEAVIKADPILSETAEKLNKFAVKKRTEVLTGAVQSALGVAGLAPSVLGPCAQLAKTAFILSTGGSEENKLYKEVFLFKRIEVRTRTISQLTSTAVRSYHMACLTNRPFLAAYAQSLMNKMADKETVEKVISGNIDTRIPVQQIADTTDITPPSGEKLSEKAAPAKPIKEDSKELLD